MTPRRSTRSALAVAALGALALTSAACGLGDKQAQADRVIDARRDTFEVGGATGAMKIEIEPSEENEEPEEAGGAAAAFGGLGGAAATRAFSVDVQLKFDFPRQSVGAIVVPPVDPLAALAAASAPAEGAAAAGAPPVEGAPPAEAPPVEAAAVPAAPTEPNTLFHGNTTYVRRTNVRPTERRLWAKLDFARLDDDERPPAVDETPGPSIAVAAANSINPLYLLELTEGVLAGSIERKGEETVNGTTAARYDANVSIDKALADLDLDDDELEIRQLMFRLLRVRDDVRPASFWVDGEGKLRRARFELRQRIDRNDTNDLTITIDLSAIEPQGEVATPDAEETVVVERFGRLIRSSLPVTAQP